MMTPEQLAAAQAWENRELKRQLDEARAELAVLTRERDMARCLAAGMDELRTQCRELEARVASLTQAFQGQVLETQAAKQECQRLRAAKEGIFK